MIQRAQSLLRTARYKVIQFLARGDVVMLNGRISDGVVFVPSGQRAFIADTEFICDRD